MQIAPKAGRLASGAYVKESPIRGNIFNFNPQAQVSNLPSDGGLLMPRDRTLTVYKSPITSQYNSATIRTQSAVVSYYNTQLFTPAAKPLVQPHVRTILNAKGQGRSRKVIRNTFVSQTSNTPFHPKKEKKVAIPNYKSEAATEKQLHHISFPSFLNTWGDANNSFIAGQTSVATNRIGAGRWNTQKKSVV